MNRKALVTGGSRGIGRGIALALAGEGYDVIVNYHSNETAARQTAEDCVEAARGMGREISARVCQADIGCTSDRQRLVAFAKGCFDRLDLLVNNAGVAPKLRADILEATESSFDHQIKTNVKGPYFLTQMVAKWMIQQRGALGIGRPPPTIITVGSISAYTASVNRGDYCVSKAALAMLTPLFATRLAEYGINVYELRPGIIATDMTEAVRDKYDALIAEGLTPMKRWGTPTDLGQAVVAVAGGAFPFSVGEVFNIDGGFHLRRL